MSKLNIVDMFCGGGGESTGLIIGNAVPPNFAKAMFSQILSEMTA